MPSSPHSGPTCKIGHAFTLVELLVSIAVVAILASLLISAVNSVVERSRQTTCASHLRSLGVGFQLYANEHEGTLPAVDYWRGNAPAAVFWYTEVQPYVAPEDLTRHGEVWKCPSIDALREPDDKLQMKPDYGLNIGISSLDADRSAIGLKQNVVEGMEKKVLLFCSARRRGSYLLSRIREFGPGIGWGDQVGPISTQSNFCEIHNDKANVLFCDGHVEPKAFEEINDSKYWDN